MKVATGDLSYRKSQLRGFYPYPLASILLSDLTQNKYAYNFFPSDDQQHRLVTERVNSQMNSISRFFTNCIFHISIKFLFKGLFTLVDFVATTLLLFLYEMHVKKKM